jgi:hypothetical protein
VLWLEGEPTANRSYHNRPAESACRPLPGVSDFNGGEDIREAVTVICLSGHDPNLRRTVQPIVRSLGRQTMRADEYLRLHAACVAMARQSQLPDVQARWAKLADDAAFVADDAALELKAIYRTDRQATRARLSQPVARHVVWLSRQGSDAA